MTAPYNWSIEPVDRSEGIQYVSQINNADGTYSVSVDDISVAGYTVIEKRFSTVKESGTYSYSYHIDSFKIGTKDSIFDLHLEAPLVSGGSIYRMAYIHVDFNVVALGIMGEDFYYSVSGDNGASDGDEYEIDFNWNMETGAYSCYIKNTTSSIDCVVESGVAATVPGDIDESIGMYIIERHLYGRDNISNFEVMTPTITSGIYKYGSTTPTAYIKYVNISDSYTTTGDGSPGNPYNYGQLLVDLTDNAGNMNIGPLDKWEYYLTGVHTVSSSQPVIFPSSFINRSGAVCSCSFIGWDIGVNGPPVFNTLYDSTSESFYCNKYGWTDTTLGPTTKLIFKDLVVNSVNMFLLSSWGANSTYKNVLIMSDDIRVIHNYYSADSSVSVYGSTVMANTFTVGGVGVFSMYDSVLDCDSYLVGWDNQYNIYEPGTLIMSDTIVTNNTTPTIPPTTNITQYIPPTYVGAVASLPKTTNSAILASIFSDTENLYYKRYNVPEYSNSTLKSFRVSNGYDYGLFGYERECQGAYSFSGTYTPTDSNNDLATSGHIGAFHFGGDYDNADVYINEAPLALYPIMSAGGSADVSPVIRPLYISPITDFVSDGMSGFPFDFSGAPRDGGSPLTVDYHIYNYAPVPPYEGKYEAIEFRWWFDFELSSSPNQYVSCATDTAQHTYCGGYLQEYDVRACVVYRAIGE